MTGPNKGRAAIIAVRTFSDISLIDNEAAVQDAENLASLWNGVGFNVYIPKKRGKDMCPTAQVRNIRYHFHISAIKHEAPSV